MRAKVAACSFARGYLGGIVRSVFQQLQDTGYFYDPVEREVSTAGTQQACRSMPCMHVASTSTLDQTWLTQSKDHTRTMYTPTAQLLASTVLQ